MDETLTLSATGGPYIEGNSINISCEVPRARGNISASNLQAYIGKKPMVSTMKENSDTTVRLSIKKTILIGLSLHNTNMSCRYVASNGTTQQEYLTIEVAEGK